MKKITQITLAIMLALTFTSCHRAEIGIWTTDIEVAKKMAVKEGKDILLLFSGVIGEEGSDEWIENNLKTPEFEQVASLKFILCNYRFTEEDFTATQLTPTVGPEQDPNAPPPPPPTKAQQKAVQKAQEKLEKRFRVVDDYQVESIPSIYLLTKEGYYVAHFAFSLDLVTKTYQDCLKSITEYEGALQQMNDTLSDIKLAKGLDKVSKIDLMFKTIKPDNAHLMIDLMQELVDTDYNNESGLVGDYELNIAKLNAMKDLSIQDFVAASNKLSSVAEKGHLSNEQKQEAYYFAGYFLLNGGATQPEEGMKFLQKSIEAAPDTPEAQVIRGQLDGIKEAQKQSQETQDVPTETSNKDNNNKEDIPSTSNNENSKNQSEKPVESTINQAENEVNN